MTLFFKKTPNSVNQKQISQQTVQSLVKKAVDGIGSKFDQSIIDQIFLSLKTKKGCKYVIKSLIDIIDQDADSDSSIFKALKVFYLCLITNSGLFRSYAQMCMPEIASISILSFKKTADNKFRNEVKIFSQQIYLNLALNTPLPSPRQLNLDKFVQSQAFLSVYERQEINNSKSLKEKETVKPKETNFQELKNDSGREVPLSNCLFVENLIEFDFPDEKPPANNENATGNDNGIFSFSSSSPNKDSDHEIQNTKLQNPASPTKVTANTEDLLQTIPEKKDYFESLIPQNQSNAPSITQSTPKLLDLVQPAQDEQFVPHKRSREKSYDPPKSDLDFLKFIDNGINTTTDKNITETVNNDNDDITNEHVQIDKDITNNDNSNLNSYIQPSMRSKSYHVFDKSKGSNASVNVDDQYPFAKQISSDSPSDMISGPSRSFDNQDDIVISKSMESDQKFEAPPTTFLDNKSRSFSLELFPSSNSLPIKSTTAKPVDQIPVKAVRFPTSPNLKDIQNKTSKTISIQKLVNFTNTENQKNDLDILGLTNSTSTISKSNTAKDILYLSESTNSPSNNSNIDFLDISSSAKEVNSTDNNNSADILDLSSSISNNMNKPKSSNNNNDEIYDLSPTNQKNTSEIFDLSNSSANISANTSNNDDILDFSNTMNATQTNNNDIDILELATSPNKSSTSSNNKNNDIDILDLSSAPNNPISKNSTGDEIDIIDLANSASTVDLIPISNIPNMMSIPHLQQSASTDKLISLTSTNDLLQNDNNNDNKFNKISAPQFIPQSPSANIPFRIHRTGLHDKSSNNNNDFGSIVSIGSHQRSYSNTTPVPVSRIIDPIQKTTTTQQQLIDDNNNNSENTSISLIESSQDEDIIPLIETKSKASTISASAPYMLQNQQQSFEVGNSALVPTSDSPLYSQGKRKDTKVKRFTISYSLDSEDGTNENESKLILPSSSFTPSTKESIRSIFSKSESSYNSFSSSDQKQQNYMQNTMLETIIEEDETNDQFEPISGRSEAGFDDNFEPIPMDDSKGGNDEFDDSFEPIVNEEEENLDSDLNFVPISPREGEIDGDFEPIEQNNKENSQQFEPIDSNDPLFESINSVNNDQFEPIYKNENNIYDQFEPITTDSVDSNKFESINSLDKNNNNNDNQQVEIEIDGFEPIQGNDSNGNNNDNFEPINSNSNNKQIDIGNDNFEPISNSNQHTEIENDNFELIDNNKQIENNDFGPIGDNDRTKLNINSFEPIHSNINHHETSFQTIENDDIMMRQIKIESSSTHSNSNSKFCSVSSDGVIVAPQAKVQPRTKKFHVKKIHSLQNIPAVSLDIFDGQQSNISPSIITDDKNS